MSGRCRFVERERLIEIGRRWIDIVLWREQQTAGSIASRAVIAAASVMVAIFATDASANGDAGNCPPEWADYVSAVGDIIKPRQDLPVIFVTREGEAFDCLDLIDGNYLLERASNFFKRDPRPRSPVDPSDPGNWPTNVCNVASTRLPHLPSFFAVELTRQVEVLDHPVCRVRVINAIRRVSGVNE